MALHDDWKMTDVYKKLVWDLCKSSVLTDFKNVKSEVTP